MVEAYVLLGFVCGCVAYFAALAGVDWAWILGLFAVGCWLAGVIEAIEDIGRWVKRR